LSASSATASPRSAAGSPRPPTTDEALGTGENAGRTRFVGLFAPILSIAGGAMSPGRPLFGSILMVLSAAGMYWGFGFGVFTMFPIAMCLVAGILGLSGALGREG
jgi:hypothetical protein